MAHEVYTKAVAAGKTGGSLGIIGKSLCLEKRIPTRLIAPFSNYTSNSSIFITLLAPPRIFMVFENESRIPTNPESQANPESQRIPNLESQQRIPNPKIEAKTEIVKMLVFESRIPSPNTYYIWN